MKKIDPRLEAPACNDLKPVVEIHQNNWFALRKRGEYFTIEYNEPQVVVLPTIEEYAMVLVSVKRPVISDCPLELPAGGCRNGEKPVAAASRELKEETGIDIRDLNRFKMMPSISILPNRFPVMPWIFSVNISQKEYDSRLEHDHEIEKVHCLSIKEAIEKIINGEIYISLPMAIISKYILTRHF